MSCIICSKDGKTPGCPLDNSVCIKCCFAISSGSPKAIKRIKELKLMMKDDVLAICAKCKKT